MDHFASLVILVCVMVVAVCYSQLHAKARFGKVGIEVKLWYIITQLSQLRSVSKPLI